MQYLCTVEDKVTGDKLIFSVDETNVFAAFIEARGAVQRAEWQIGNSHRICVEEPMTQNVEVK